MGNEPGENDQMSTPTQATAQDWLTDAARILGAALADWTSKDAEVAVVAKSFREDASLRGELPSSGAAYVLGLKTEEGEGRGLLFLGPEPAARTAQALGSAEAGEQPLDEEGLQALASGLEPIGGALSRMFADLDAEPDGEPRFALLHDSTWNEDGGDPVPSGELFGAELEWRIDGGSASGVLLLMPAAMARAALDLGSETADATADPATLQGPLLVFGLSTKHRKTVERAAGEHGLMDAGDLGDLVRGFPKPETGGAIVEVKVGQEFLLPNLRALKAFPGCAPKPLVVILQDTSPVSVMRAARLGLFGLLPNDFQPRDVERRIQEELAD